MFDTLEKKFPKHIADFPIWEHDHLVKMPDLTRHTEIGSPMIAEVALAIEKATKGVDAGEAMLGKC